MARKQVRESISSRAILGTRAGRRPRRAKIISNSWRATCARMRHGLVHCHGAKCKPGTEDEEQTYRICKRDAHIVIPRVYLLCMNRGE